VHCSVLAEEAIKAAVADYYKKNGIDKEIPAPAHCHECEVGGHEH
jgi:nitrogen fixation NifU-like protein